MSWDQIITDHYQAQLAFQGQSGLPEDQFITTWMFRNDNVLDRDGMLNAVDTALTNFFQDPAAAAGSRIVDFMPYGMESPTLKIFDMGQAPPRVPEERVLTGIVTEDTAMPLPREVAICGSYNVGGPGPRNRGRVYLGPWTISVLAQQANTGHAQVSETLRNLIAGRMEDLATNPSLECTWVLWSRANAATFVITGGFVDNAFDTIRKRGKTPEARTSWGAPIASGVGGDPGGGPTSPA